MGTYPGPRNWEVNLDVIGKLGWNDCFVDAKGAGPGAWTGFDPKDGGPPYVGCAYGGEFYRTLMSVQVFPYTKNKQIWYCPSDKFRSPDAFNIGNGLQSYQWFPNWVYNVWCPGSTAGYPGPFPCLGPNLWDSNPSEKVDRVSDRMLFTERGTFGWDGADYIPPNTNFNHPKGYNAVYFDSHVKLVVFGRKNRTLPASPWPPPGQPNPIPD